MKKSFKVTLVKGISRSMRSQRLTLMALGLKKRHSSVVISDNSANRGQIMKVQHLIQVDVIGD